MSTKEVLTIRGHHLEHFSKLYGNEDISELVAQHMRMLRQRSKWRGDWPDYVIDVVGPDEQSLKLHLVRRESVYRTFLNIPKNTQTVINTLPDNIC